MKKDLLKFPLKRVLLSAVILCSLSAIFTSCGDDAEGRITLNDKAPAKVTNVTTAAGPGEVYITWTNPTSESCLAGVFNSSDKFRSSVSSSRLFLYIACGME